MYWSRSLRTEMSHVALPSMGEIGRNWAGGGGGVTKCVSSGTWSGQ